MAEAVSNVKPNQFAPPPETEFTKAGAVVHGYQHFVVGEGGIRPLPEDQKLVRKHYLLQPYFVPRLLKTRTVLDIGANAGFFSFWALQQGANQATALDIDEQYLEMMRAVHNKVGQGWLVVKSANMAEWTERSDVVLAFAMIHWLYSCTTTFGSLDEVIGYLAQLTNVLLLVEWVAERDPAIQFFGHTAYNADQIRGPYTFAAFEAAMRKHFEVVEPIGFVSSTRKLYAGWKRARDQRIDVSCPLPAVRPVNELISCSLVGNKGSWPEYWSRVYDAGTHFVKQASFDLAAREAFFLRQLDGPGFPRVLEVNQEALHSMIMLEKVEGHSLATHAAHCKNDLPATVRLAHGLVGIVRQMAEKSIQHRDITARNILVRDGRPVLLDFGWAIAPGHEYFTPPGLGEEFRPRDGSFCDIYSVGTVLDMCCAKQWPELDRIISLMTNPDPRLRVVDLEVLSTLLDQFGDGQERQ